MAPSLSTATTAIVGTVATALAARSLDSKYNIRSDIAQIRAGLKSKKHFGQLCKNYGEDDWSFYHVLHDTYGLNDYDEAFLFEDRSWTYAQMRTEAGRLAAALKQLGIGNRTVVAMFINNSPEFYFLWWALFKIGAIPAPLNTSIGQEPFRHCLRVSAAEYLLCSYELYETMTSSLDLTEPALPSDDKCISPQTPDLRFVAAYDYGTYPPPHSLCTSVATLKQNDLPLDGSNVADWPPEFRPKIKSTDISQYLFTSGTTGLPKAATFPTAFCHMSANPHRWPVMWQKKRRAYLCPPMFHGGSTYAVLPAVVATGGTIVLARRFSVRNFWPDVRRTRSDLVFYIGEMIRYLVQAPPDVAHPDETQTHQLDIIYGMGLAEPIWREFRRRFDVQWISEYYGATEGTTVICYSNWNDDGVAKVAHWGPLMRFMQDSFYILRVDMESGDFVRHPKTGLCIQAAYGEVGEAVNRVTPPLQRTHPYVGPDGPEQTDKKLVRDVFKKGDLFVRLGDALSMDKNGYVTFHDRLGDTYRAKGHNISTAEVEKALETHPQIASANVFAINMRQFGYDGQVGCAAITMQGEKEKDNMLQDLEQYLTSKGGLPGYAVPRFVRILANGSQENHLVSDAVGSEHVNPIFKKIKMTLREAGFAPPEESSDFMYWIEREGSGFVPLTRETQQGLLAGKAKL